MSEERAARNEVTFREANERIADTARELEIDWRSPYICECETRECAELVRLSLQEYAHVRAEPTQFVIAPGHTFRSGHIVAERDGYFVVRKTGRSGEIAEEDAGD